MGALPPGARGSQESGPGHLGFLGRKKYGSFGFAATRSLEPQKTARHVRFGDPPVSLAPLIDPPDVDGGREDEKAAREKDGGGSCGRERVWVRRRGLVVLLSYRLGRRTGTCAGADDGSAPQE